MEIIPIKSADRLSQVYIVPTRWAAAEYLVPGRTVVVTDCNLWRLHQAEWLNLPVIVIPPGEKSKSLGQVQKVYRRLLDLGVDRDWTLIGWGGGVVTDLAGFCAATYLRGIACVMVATSLLAQVDASVGGKNGVNYAGLKNIIGTIVQPQAVICPQDVLSTLPRRHFINGLAEVIKVAASGDRELCELLQKNREAVLRRQPDVLSEIVSRAVRYKAMIVSQDERESGLRRVLNFGHTFGHAIEMATGRLHGYAVAIGMLWAVRIGHRLGITPHKVVTELEHLIRAYGLPTEVSVEREVIEKLIRRDKKRHGDELNFVCLSALGSARVVPLPFAQLLELWDDLHLAG